MAKARIEEHGITDDGLIAHVHLVLGLGYIAAGCWDRALQVNLRARAVLEELGDLAQVASILNNLGLIHVETGRYDEGEQLLLRTLSLYSELNDVLSTGYTFTELGRLYFKKGDLAAALRYGSRALSIFWEHKGLMDKAEVARLCELFGSIAHATGDRDGALNYMRRATTYYAQRGLWREWAGSSQELERILQTPPGAPTLAKAAIDWQDKQRLRFFTTLLGLMDTLESLYPSRRGKAELVTKYALILGEAAGLASGRLEELSHAARLHDVGLTSMETDLDQGLVTEELGMDHPLLGERVLKMFGVSDRVQLAVRHQHEHFDGSGGPDGLAGEQIPLYSRIIAVADAYVEQVLSSDDPKKAHTGAFGYVQSCAGRKFDPMIVDVFVRLHEV